MTGQSEQTVLQRKAQAVAAGAALGPITVERALRLALTRAAEAAVGLRIAVLGVADQTLPLEEVLGVLSDEMVMLSLRDPKGAVIGLAAMDNGLRGAMIEMQTMGCLFDAAPADRSATGVDASLSEPLVTALFTEMASAPRADLSALVEGIAPGPRVLDVRSFGLMFSQAQFRLFRMTVDFGRGDRQGELFIVLRKAGADAGADPQQDPAAMRWAARMEAAVADAPASLHAVLHRLRLPFQDVDRLEVGQILALPGATVGGLRLEAPDGALVARARLGQAAGLRAAKLMQPQDIAMEEATLGPRPTGAHAQIGVEVAQGTDRFSDQQTFASEDGFEEQPVFNPDDGFAAAPIDSAPFAMDGPQDDGFPQIDFDADIPAD